MELSLDGTLRSWDLVISNRRNDEKLRRRVLAAEGEFFSSKKAKKKKKKSQRKGNGSSMKTCQSSQVLSSTSFLSWQQTQHQLHTTIVMKQLNKADTHRPSVPFHWFYWFFVMISMGTLNRNTMTSKRERFDDTRQVQIRSIALETIASLDGQQSRTREDHWLLTRRSHRTLRFRNHHWFIHSTVMCILSIAYCTLPVNERG